MSNLNATTVMCPECGSWNVPGHPCRINKPFQDIANEIANALAREVRETDALKCRLTVASTLERQLVARVRELENYVEQLRRDRAVSISPTVYRVAQARIYELEGVIDGMNKQADIVQIGSNRRWELLEESLTNFYRIELGITGNETAAELAHRMAEKIHLELYEDLETNKG